MRRPIHYQLDSFDCGPACLKMVAEFYGKDCSLDNLRETCYLTREGVSLLGISQGAEKIGLRTLMVKLDLETLIKDCSLPAILHWNQNHFIVLYRVSERRLRNKSKQGKPRRFLIGDPAHGKVQVKEDDFVHCWQSSDAERGIALLLEPTPAFYAGEEASNQRQGFAFLLNYLRPFRRQMAILLGFMLLSTLITVSFPYLTKGLIDKGVMQRNENLILLFALSQLFLFFSGTVLNIVRSWLLLHMSAKISLNILSEFLGKLLKLPIRFFDSKSVGDLSQRINDHHRIEGFLTGDLVNSLFSVAYIVIFSCILLFYQWSIWVVYLTLSAAGVSWIFMFQGKRKKLDYIRFTRNKSSQEKLFEMVVGMQEIKLYGGENYKKWEWEFIQQRLYKLNIKSLTLEQYQQSGFVFFSHFKNIIISFFSALYVMDGKISLGTMLSISFIIGQTNGPLEQLVQFFKSAQDARLSMGRLQEVKVRENEEDEAKMNKSASIAGMPDDLHASIHIRNLSFQYQGPRSPLVLDTINLVIPKGKVTAIIGASGSGKTTLMKLLLGFYQPSGGSIRVGEHDLSELSPAQWRSQCGTVMQDGYIFYDTVSKNIAMRGEDVDHDRLKKSVSVSNVDEFVRDLPLGYNTRIGASGIGLSGGQKQRILIARAVYKNPHYLFFDEATSNLDANNEHQIMEKLNDFFTGKTVLVVAHRLSTVKRADQIIVLERGKIVELGNHDMLTRRRGKYFDLVRNQLELGN